MPISLPDVRPIDVVRVEANSFKILGFEVHTETDQASDDRVFVRKEARTVTNGVITARTPMRGTQYNGATMLPVLGDIAARFAAAVGLALPSGDVDALGYALYVAFRDGLYEAERRAGEFPADAN